MVYLTQGKLHPEFVPVEMGMAEKLAIRAVAEASGVSEEDVKASLDSTGDLGATAQDLLERTRRPPPHLSIEEVYRRLDAIARTAGPGSVAEKVEHLAELLRQATPVEAKYIVRTATGKLRLGLADMTMLMRSPSPTEAENPHESRSSGLTPSVRTSGRWLRRWQRAGSRLSAVFISSQESPFARCSPKGCPRPKRFWRSWVDRAGLSTSTTESVFRSTK